ncbi:NAD(P)H-dependent oxidoreductase subunit E [Haliovirga abyssi]|uniref:NADH dehydrogenase n=1 Tax=Haliovirga abyssi TaxID=2996794 RepID=A0AAU9DF46_9FUSO|nr:NAD(P)H-dependent oxidoreductase subunit E [Haliovirga abyssi]BDU51032.1 NADH dehydrogenase [Haliovirga abyssi]
MDIYICMGSACYLKGSNKIITIFKNEFEKLNKGTEHNILELKGSFCLGPCNQGVAIKIGDKIFKNYNPNNCKDRLYSELIPYIEELEKEKN